MSEKIRAPLPGEPLALAATAPPLVPRPLRRFHESPHTPQVAADADVIAVAAHAYTARGVRRLDRPMPVAAAPIREGRRCPSEPRPPCLAPPPPVTVAGAPPGDRAPPKVTGGRTVPLLLRLWRRPQRQPPRLVRVAGPSEAPPPCAEYGEHPSCVILPCTAEEEVSTKAPQRRTPLQSWRPLGVTPSVAPVMPIDVAHQRRAPRPLGGFPTPAPTALHRRVPPRARLCPCAATAPPPRPARRASSFTRGEPRGRSRTPCPPRQSTAPHPPPRAASGCARRHGHCARAGSHTRRPDSPAPTGPPPPHARRRGPAGPRTPRGPAAGASPGPWGWTPGGAADGGTASSAAARAGLGDLPPRAARTVPGCPPPPPPRRLHADGDRRVCGPAHRSDGPGRGTVLRGRVALCPLPAHVPGPCPPMSAHWAWVPPAVHPDTGRLCSAGSGCPPVPRRHRPYAALRLPAPIGHGSGSPCRWPPSRRPLVLCPPGPTTRAPAPCRASETGRRLAATPGDVEARASQGTGPSSAGVRWSNTPPDTLPSSPTARRGRCGLRENPARSASGKTRGVGAAVPRPARSPADASPAVSPRPAQGGRPAWAGAPLAGEDAHLLGDEQRCMATSPPPIPFDPQGLVALKILYVPAQGRPMVQGRGICLLVRQGICGAQDRQ